MLAAALLVLAFQTPDLSGTWTMDAARSESAHQDLPIGPIVLTIKQTTSGITIDTARRPTKSGAPVHEVISYNLDNSESVNANPGKSIINAKAHWEGETLVTETVRNIQDSTVTTIYKHHLEASGHDLVIEKTLTVQHGYQFQGSRTTGRGKDVFVKDSKPSTRTAPR